MLSFIIILRFQMMVKARYVNIEYPTSSGKSPMNHSSYFVGEIIVKTAPHRQSDLKTRALSGDRALSKTTK